MTRYERVKQIMDSLPEKERRACPMLRKLSACACIGCATSKGISKEMIDKYLRGELK